MRLKKLSFFLLFILTAFTLFGCYDSREIGEFSYVSIMGIEEGENDKIKFTFKINEYAAGEKGGQSSGGEDSAATVTIEAPSFSVAINYANTYITKKLNFMHLKAIVISESLAKNGDVGSFITPLLRHREIRRTTIVTVCKGTAEEFVDAIEPHPGEVITKSIEEIMEKSEETGYFPRVTLNSFYDGLKAPYHALLVGYSAINEKVKESEESESGKKEEESKGKKEGQEGQGGQEGQEGQQGKEGQEGEGKKEEDRKKASGDYYAGDLLRVGGDVIEHFGCTLFDGDKMVGKLTGHETKMLMIARGDLSNATINFEDPKEPEMRVALHINEFDDPKIEMDMSDPDKPKAHITIELEGYIMEIPSLVDYELPENKKLLEEAAEKHIKTGIEKTYDKCIEAKTDVFNIGTRVAKYFLTIPEWEEYNWLSKFPNTELTVEVDFTIRRTGKIIKTVPMFSTEGKE